MCINCSALLGPSQIYDNMCTNDPPYHQRCSLLNFGLRLHCLNKQDPSLNNCGLEGRSVHDLKEEAQIQSSEYFHSLSPEEHFWVLFTEKKNLNNSFMDSKVLSILAKLLVIICVSINNYCSVLGNKLKKKVSLSFFCFSLLLFCMILCFFKFTVEVFFLNIFVSLWSHCVHFSGHIVYFSVLVIICCRFVSRCAWFFPSLCNSCHFFTLTYIFTSLF